MPTILTFTFRHSVSRDFPYILRLAKRGAYKEEALGPKAILYQSMFDVANPLHLAPAIALATALVHDKKALATVNGQHIGIPMIRSVLICFEQSWQIDDLRAFCQVKLHVGSDPGLMFLDLEPTEKSDVRLPCRLASNKAGMVRASNPAPIQDQIKAVLVKAETHWCPRLQPLEDLAHRKE